MKKSKEQRERDLKLELAYCRKDVTAIARKIIGNAKKPDIAAEMMLAESTLNDKIRLGRFRADELLLMADICGKTIVIEDKHPDLMR